MGLRWILLVFFRGPSGHPMYGTHDADDPDPDPPPQREEWLCATTEEEFLLHTTPRPRGAGRRRRLAWGTLCDVLARAWVALHQRRSDAVAALHASEFYRTLHAHLHSVTDLLGIHFRKRWVIAVLTVGYVSLRLRPEWPHPRRPAEEPPVTVRLPRSVVPPNRCPPHQLPIREECLDRTQFLENPSDRAFVVENVSPARIWIALIGPGAWLERPHLTGFELESGGVKVVPLPENLASIRLWARTGCRWVEGTISRAGLETPVKKFVCDTGDCGAAENEYGIPCKAIAGQPPATLAEFTLQREGNDFYDLSNVDGHNMGIRIEPVGPWRPAVGEVDPLYNCGAPQCSMDASKCPPELQVEDLEGRLNCLSVCQAVYSERQRADYPILQDLWEARTDRGRTRDLLCCTCGEGEGLCEALGSPCTYGCSPFVIGYTGPEYAVRKCHRINNTFLPDWPNASTGENYAQVFDTECPQAYSWQFNDDQSTYQCKGADYRVTFYSHRTAPPATAATAAAPLPREGPGPPDPMARQRWPGPDP